MVFVSKMFECCITDATGTLQLLDWGLRFTPPGPDEVPQIPTLFAVASPVVAPAWEDRKECCCWIDVPSQLRVEFCCVLDEKLGGAGAEEKSERMSCLTSRFGSGVEETDPARGA